MIKSNLDKMYFNARHPVAWHCERIVDKISGAKRRMLLLDEFLRRESARQQTSVEEETVSGDSEIEFQNQVTLSYDLLFKIFILLPVESLFRSQFVCKMWFSLINRSNFVSCHSQQSETVLICKKLTPLKSGRQEDKPRSYFHILDSDGGGNQFIESRVFELVDIRASYNGLIVATTEKSKSLILMNPVTRKHIAFPLGTKHDFFVGSFGIAFCDEEKEYKVVHLFREKLASIRCEILHVSKRKWTRIEGPPPELVVDIRETPVTVGGSLHWMSSEQGCDYFVFMNVHDEKFICKKLPVNRGPKDCLLEIGGDLGFVSHAQLDLLQVWVLITNGGSGENWLKKYSINLSVYAAFPSPICCSKNGKGMVLEMKNELYAYKFETGEMKLIQSRTEGEVWFGRMVDEYIPHRNTLASWEDLLEVLR